MSAGCGCAPCDLKAAALRGDPASRKLLSMAGLAPAQASTIGNIMPQVVYPSDVQKFKERLDPSMVTTDAAVTACTNPSLSDGERTAWKAFYAAWRTFFGTPIPLLFGASNDWDNTQAFETQLAGWQEELKKKCNVPGPTLKVAEEPDFAVLKWVSVAVVAVAIVYGVHEVRSIL